MKIKAVPPRDKIDMEPVAGPEAGPRPDPLPCQGAGEIDRLYHDLGQAELPERTRALMAAKLPKKAKKLIEEAAEVGLDAVLGNSKGLVNESVDVLYHLIVLWRSCDIPPEAVWAEMNRRANQLGVSEKLPKKIAKKEILDPAP